MTEGVSGLASPPPSAPMDEGDGRSAGRGDDRWTRRRWVYSVTLVFALQAAVVMLLVRNVPPRPPRPLFPTRVHLVTDTAALDRLKSLPGYLDPALFALPSLDGFSGSAWLKYPRLQHSPMERSETPEWLALGSSNLGGSFMAYLSSNQIRPPLLVDEPLPPALRYNLNYPGEPLAPTSRVRLEGELAKRELTGPATFNDLPSWQSLEIVSNTTVRAVVDANGYTFSATLISRSGLPAADDYAVQLVESARFRQLPDVDGGGASTDRMTWGVFVFLWRTLPVPSTNGVIPAP